MHLEKQETHLTFVKKAIKDNVVTYKRNKFGWMKSNKNQAYIHSKSTRSEFENQVLATFMKGNLNLTQNWPHWNPSMCSQGDDKNVETSTWIKKSQALPRNISKTHNR